MPCSHLGQHLKTYRFSPFLRGKGATFALEVYEKDRRMADFQVWILTVKNGKGVLRGYADTPEKPVVTQRIPYTDFDQPEIRLYVAPNDIGGRRVWTILLPSEY